MTSEREGECVRTGVFKYPATTEEARWARTREIIQRVAPRPYEDPRFFEMLCRHAASVELLLAGDVQSEKAGAGVPRNLLTRILIGSTGEPPEPWGNQAGRQEAR